MSRRREELVQILQARGPGLISILQMGISLVNRGGPWYNKAFQIHARGRAVSAERRPFMGIHDGHREKMRRRFRETGLEGFADHEALELLLYYAIPRRDTNPIAHALMDRYDSLSAVLNAPVEDLQKVEGIGESAAVLLSLVARISRKARLADAAQETVLNSSERAGTYLLERFSGETREQVYLLCLDRKGKLLACKRLADGDVASADLNIRKVVETALLTSASAAILSHNHPSGVALPSADDEAATRQVRDALRTIGVELVDHIIVADRDFVSMADSGLLG